MKTAATVTVIFWAVVGAVIGFTGANTIASVLSPEGQRALGMTSGIIMGFVISTTMLMIHGYGCARATALLIWNRLPEKIDVTVNNKIIQSDGNGEWWRDSDGDKPGYADDSSGDP